MLCKLNTWIVCGKRWSVACRHRSNGLHCLALGPVIGNPRVVEDRYSDHTVRLGTDPVRDSWCQTPMGQHDSVSGQAGLRLDVPETALKDESPFPGQERLSILETDLQGRSGSGYQRDRAALAIPGHEHRRGGH